MLTLVIAIVVAAAISAALLLYSGAGYDGRHTLAGIFGVILAILTCLTAIAYAFVGWGWLAADSKAQIINREYGTSYTREEVFFASDVIDTIREIDRKRVEVNGNLMREDIDEHPNAAR